MRRNLGHVHLARADQKFAFLQLDSADIVRGRDGEPLLKQRGVAEIEEVRVDLDPAAKTHMMSITGRRTVPQIFIGDTHVGGCDDLVALDQRGGLLPLLNA